MHDPAVWNEGHILTSTAERDALRRLYDLGLHDAYRLHHEDGGVFSWWDYRQAAFRRNLGLRIDLTLVSEALARRSAAAPASTASRAPGTGRATTRRRGCRWGEAGSGESGIGNRNGPNDVVPSEARDLPYRPDLNSHSRSLASLGMTWAG